MPDSAKQDDQTRHTAAGLDFALVTAGCAVDLVVLTYLSLASAEGHNAVNSATPVADGALLTLQMVLGLVLTNGLLLCVSRRTRPVGLGVVAGTALAVPFGFAIFAIFAAAHLD